jgi:shikimate dehydrogenase
MGMHAEDPLPLNVMTLSASTAVAEIIMSPEITPLLAAAQALGCRTALGKQMLDEQYKLVKELLQL